MTQYNRKILSRKLKNSLTFFITSRVLLMFISTISTRIVQHVKFFSSYIFVYINLCMYWLLESFIIHRVLINMLLFIVEIFKCVLPLFIFVKIRNLWFFLLCCYTHVCKIFGVGNFLVADCIIFL